MEEVEVFIKVLMASRAGLYRDVSGSWRRQVSEADSPAASKLQHHGSNIPVAALQASQARSSAADLPPKALL
jgi:hypothetical protein